MVQFGAPFPHFESLLADVIVSLATEGTPGRYAGSKVRLTMELDTKLRDFDFCADRYATIICLTSCSTSISCSAEFM